MPKTFAKSFQCRVLDVVWATPSVVRIRFEPSKRFDFLPGQFLSVVIPPFHKRGKQVKRCYSFASGPEEAKRNGYELCVKYVHGGVGSGFLGSLTPGDRFEAFAPYGDFVFRHPAMGRSVCFIATGTGIAPFRSAVFSEAFHQNPPAQAICLQGVGSTKEILYAGAFEARGVETIYAVSRPEAGWTGFQGRVTDYLRAMPRDWRWHSTDFYICGNGPMVQEVAGILRSGFGVQSSSIHKENFSAVARPSLVPGVAPAAEPQPQRGKILPFRLPFFPEAA